MRLVRAEAVFAKMLFHQMRGVHGHGAVQKNRQ
jgi:hypothetical protein